MEVQQYDFGHESGPQCHVQLYSRARHDHLHEHNDMNDSIREQDSLDVPLGSKVWPAAYAMCTYFTEHQTNLHQRNVLELGAGTG